MVPQEIVVGVKAMKEMSVMGMVAGYRLGWGR